MTLLVAPSSSSSTGGGVSTTILGGVYSANPLTTSGFARCGDDDRRLISAGLLCCDRFGDARFDPCELGDVRFDVFGDVKLNEFE